MCLVGAIHPCALPDACPSLTDRKTTIEYLTEDTFREFLYQRTKVNNGVLQRFIEPKGIHNCA